MAKVRVNCSIEYDLYTYVNETGLSFSHLLSVAILEQKQGKSQTAERIKELEETIERHMRIQQRLLDRPFYTNK